MKILIHSNAAWGGVVDYMMWQARAMVKLGHEVTLLVPKSFDKTPAQGIAVRPVLPDLETRANHHPVIRRVRWIRRLLAGWRITADETSRLEPDFLLLSAYSEYLAPLWVSRFGRLRRRFPTLKMGAIVHDPIRLPLGPVVWHRRSVRVAYEMLDVTYVHSPITVDQAGATPPVPTHQIPFGVYDFPDAGSDTLNVREAHGILPSAHVLFAFGHVRDGKNLDLAIRLLPDFPDLHLVIAGKVMSSRDRPIKFYQDLANGLDVAGRLTILDRFIPETEAADLFEASDLVLLSYDAGFVSASSVLHVALKFRKPVLATSGDGHLKWAVETYNLGIWTEPDSLEALKSGLEAALEFPCSSGRWADYERENTWETNASQILSAFQDEHLESSCSHYLPDADPTAAAVNE